MASFLDFDFTSPLPHPGEILREAYLAPRRITASALAATLGLPSIEQITVGLEPITADTALRLERALGVDAQFWMDLQSQHDLSKAAIESRSVLLAIETWESALEAE